LTLKLKLIDAGDEAVVIWIMRGTPNAKIEGILPLEVEGVSIVTADGSVLTTASLYADSAALNEALRLAAKNKRGE
jgi:hypothetical protein